MTDLVHALKRIAPTLLLLAQVPVAAAAPAPAAPASSGGATGVIALPLNPVVQAEQRVCTTRTASGLGYTMLRPGSGAMPGETDYVLVNYIGYLAANGTVFDQGMRAAFPVNGVISGFAKGLQMLARNGIARLCIPAALGYGDRESGPIPAGSDLVFQVELVDFKSAAEIEAMRKAQAPGEAGAAPAGNAAP